MKGGLKEPFVADCSVAIAWTVLAQSTAECTELRDDIATGRAFVVPVLWYFEASNSLLMLKRRHRIDPEEWADARRSLDLLTPVIDDEGMRLALNPIAEIADEYDLTAYDATYLELAIRRGLPLASRDLALNRAARRGGVRTLLGSEKMTG